MHPHTFDLAVAIPTLTGSLLSCFASGLIFLCYIFLPQIPHFRHVLIINLAAAGMYFVLPSLEH